MKNTVYGGGNSLLLLSIALALAGSAVSAFAPDVNSVGYVNVAFQPGFTLFSNPLLASDNSVGHLLPHVPEGTVILKWGANDTANSLPEPQATAVRNWLTNFPAAPASGGGGMITTEFTNGVLTLTWSGTLQTATNVTGPYRDVTATNQPLQIQTSEPHRFWRTIGLSGTNASNTAAVGVSLDQFTADVFEYGQWTDPALTLVPGEGAVFYNPTTNDVPGTFVGEIEQGTLTNSVLQGLSLLSSKIPQPGGITSNLLLTPNAGDQVILWHKTAFQTYTFQSDQTWSPAEPQVPVGSAFFIRAGQSFVWQRVFSTNP